jgi:hypothetical protein
MPTRHDFRAVYQQGVIVGYRCLNCHVMYRRRETALTYSEGCK